MKTHEINKIRPFSALIDACWREPYSLARLLKDAIAGVTVGIIAIPLAMALAIASGVPPQYGLYTAAIAGIVIAVSGGSRYSVSGPTAAFVVILYPVSQQFGLAGLLVATLISGVFLLLMGLARFGRLIEYIPLPVTLGFTSGIAITIATMQIKDFFGLQLAHTPENYVGKLYALLQALPTLDFGDTLIGAVTLLILIFWPKLGLRVPGHLPALLAGTALMGLLALFDHPVATIGSRFSYLLADGSSGQGIPPILPQLLLPWDLPGGGGQPFTLSWQTVSALLPAAFSMAMLGAIESLLCAVVLDGMTGKKHNSNSELIGQGAGNIIAPFFGGITATAAIARSAANVRAGATSPVSAIIHALLVLLALLVLAPWLSYLPLAAMAALLLMVAWNMSEAHKVIYLLRRAPGRHSGAAAVHVADGAVRYGDRHYRGHRAGVAAVYAPHRPHDAAERAERRRRPPGTAGERPAVLRRRRAHLYRTAGAQRRLSHDRAAMGCGAGARCRRPERPAALYRRAACGQKLVITDVPFQPLKTLAHARVQPIEGRLQFYPTLPEALAATGA